MILLTQPGPETPGGRSCLGLRCIARDVASKSLALAHVARRGCLGGSNGREGALGVRSAHEGLGRREGSRGRSARRKSGEGPSSGEVGHVGHHCECAVSVRSNRFVCTVLTAVTLGTWVEEEKRVAMDNSNGFEGRGSASRRKLTLRRHWAEETAAVPGFLAGRRRTSRESGHDSKSVSRNSELTGCTTGSNLASTKPKSK